MAPQSNIYEAGTANIRAIFEDYVDGDSSRIALSIASSPLDQASRTAIENSLDAFGYGKNACSFASLAPYDPEAEGGDIELDPESLFLLVEALDPMLLVVADEKAAHLVARSYRAAFDLDAATRIFGRPAAIFGDLQSLIQTDNGKQKAWKILKSFPKR